MDKMSFYDYLSTWDSEDGSVDDKWKQHWIKSVPSLLSDKNTQVHVGDCTNQCCSCCLCTVETMLREYREYFFEK